MDESRESLLQIGSVAERVGLSLRTLRYWDEIGLIRPSTRTDGGFRLYSESDVERIRIVMKMRPLRLSLEEMAHLLHTIELSADVRELDPETFAAVLSTLSDYAERTRLSIIELEQELTYARELHTLIVEHFARCDAASAWAKGPSAE